MPPLRPPITFTFPLVVRGLPIEIEVVLELGAPGARLIAGPPLTEPVRVNFSVLVSGMRRIGSMKAGDMEALGLYLVEAARRARHDRGDSG
jgi:hypothetical protein